VSNRPTTFPFGSGRVPGFALYLGFFAVYTVEAARLLHRQPGLPRVPGPPSCGIIFFATLIWLHGWSDEFPAVVQYLSAPRGQCAGVHLSGDGGKTAVARYQLPLATYDFVLAALYMGD